MNIDIKTSVEEIKALTQIGQHAKALPLIQTIVEYVPDQAIGHWLLFRAQSELGNETEMISSLTRAIELEPTLVTADVHYNLALRYIGLNQAGIAKGCLERSLQLTPTFRDARLALAALLERTGEPGKALVELELACKIDPSLAEHSNKEHVNFSVPNKIYRLIRIIQSVNDKMLTLPESKKDLSRVALNAFQDGLAAVGRGSIKDALTSFDQALKASPECVEAKFNSAVLLRSLGDLSNDHENFVAATGKFKEVLESGSYRAAVHMEIGSIMHTVAPPTLKDAESILEQYQNAASADPDLAEAYLEIGGIKREQGWLIESFGYFAKYIQAFERRRKRSKLGHLNVRILDEGNTYAMGHLAFLPDCYIKLQKLGWIPNYESILIAPPGWVANYCLLDYWSEYFHVEQNLEQIRKLQGMKQELGISTFCWELPDGKCMTTNQALAVVQQEWDRRGLQPLLTLKESDRARGRAALKALGMPEDAWFVSLHVREAGFKREGDGLYNHQRNADIDTYIPAIEAITAKGGWVIRMGEPSMKKLPPMERIIEYSHSPFKSDWMDIFLCADCRFFLSGHGGITLTPKVFGVPVVITNVPPAISQYGAKDLMLPKLLWSTSENRHLSFMEGFSPPIFYCENGFRLANLGIQAICNSSEEILEVTVEMLERVENRCIYDSEDQQLQNRIQQLFPEDFGVLLSRYGRGFLRRHKQLL